MLTLRQEALEGVEGRVGVSLRGNGDAVSGFDMVWGGSPDPDPGSG